MKYNLIKVSAISIAIMQSLSAVIPGSARIQTSTGTKWLEEVVSGERVLSADANSLARMNVLRNVAGSRRNSAILIDFGGRKIIAAPDQQLFDPIRQEWVAAEDLTHENTLMGDDMYPVDILDVRRKRHHPLHTRFVLIAQTHQLFTDGVLSHNGAGPSSCNGSCGGNGGGGNAGGWAGVGMALGTWGWRLIRDEAAKKVIHKTAEQVGAVLDNNRDGAGAGHRTALQELAFGGRVAGEAHNDQLAAMTRDEVQEYLRSHDLDRRPGAAPRHADRQEIAIKPGDPLPAHFGQQDYETGFIDANGRLRPQLSVEERLTALERQATPARNRAEPAPEVVAARKATPPREPFRYEMIQQFCDKPAAQVEVKPAPEPVEPERFIEKVLDSIPAPKQIESRPAAAPRRTAPVVPERQSVNELLLSMNSRKISPIKLDSIPTQKHYEYELPTMRLNIPNQYPKVELPTVRFNIPKKS